MKFPPERCLCTVKIGDKGQIVIPKQMREMFGIVPGDNLLLLADAERGIAIINDTDYLDASLAAMLKGVPAPKKGDPNDSN